MSVRISDILARVMNGLGYAAIFTFIALTVLKVNSVDVTVDDIWTNMLGSMLLGVYFGLSSFLFQIPDWSLLRSVITHFALSAAVFIPIAIWTGWMPLSWNSILFGMLIFVLTYVVFSGGYAFYYWRLAKEMNDSIDNRNK